MTLIHGAGVDCPAPRIVTYSRPSCAKPPSPLKNSKSALAGPDGGTPTGCMRFRVDRRDWRSRSRQTVELIARDSARPTSTTRATEESRARVSGEMRSARSTKTGRAPLHPDRGRD